MSYGILATMANELIFIFHTVFVLSAACGVLFLGRHATQALVCIYTVLANLFIVKKMVLFGCVTSGSDVYIVGSICALMMSSLVWGEQCARSTAFLSGAVSVLFFILCWFQIAYVPLPIDTMHEIFALVLSRMPHITFFSIAAHYCAQRCTIALSRLAHRVSTSIVRGRTLVGALVVGQLVDGIIFFGGVFGFSVTVSTLVQMIFMSVLIKMGALVAGSFLVMGVEWCKEHGYV
jgi:uncharacterized integral membrane protein (TIGR00697 family)